MRFLAFIPVLLGCALVGCDSVDVTLSPDGDVTSPADALARVRDLRARGRLPSDRPVTIGVAPGRYFVGCGLRLTDGDSGIRFVGASPEACVFDGGVRLAPFRVLSDGTWETDAPDGFGDDQLWVNGRRAVRARLPNAGYHYMRDMDADEPNRDFFVEPAVAARLAVLPKDELDRVRFQVWQNWDTGYVMVDSVDAKTGHVVGHNRLMWPFFRSVRRETPRYVVENFRTALDAPGEWFHDRARGKILYVPRPGESAEDTVAVVPRAAEILLVSGAHDVTFEGIGFEHAGWRIGREGVGNFQSAYLTTNAAIVVERSRRVKFRNVRLSHAGAHGVWFADGATESEWTHSLVEDVGACGVRIGPSRTAGSWKTAQKRPTEEEIARRIRIADSIVRAGGREEEGASGVLLTHAADCEIVHNDVYDFYYTGISAGWTWGDAPTFVRNNLIDFNNLHHLNQGHLADMAGIYTLGNSEGTVVRGNWIHDIAGYRHTFPTWGLYSDEGSRGILFVSNLVERCAEAGMHQNYGRENVYADNVFIGFDRHGFRRSRHAKHLSVTLRGNVFVWDDPSVPFLDSLNDQPIDDIVFSNNVAFCRGGTPKNLPNGVSAVASVDFSDLPARRAAAGVDRGNAAWAAVADEATWDGSRRVPQPPRYRSTLIRQEFDRLPVGAFRPKARTTYGYLNAFAEGQDALSIREEDGGKVLRVVRTAAEKQSWAPHLYTEFSFFDCRVEVGFRIRLDAGAKVRCVARDYSGDRPKSRSFATGCSICLDETVLPTGTWSTVRVTLDLVSRTWTADLGFRRLSGTFQDGDFRDFTWLGFMSEGALDSVWWLDDLRIERTGRGDAP